MAAEGGGRQSRIGLPPLGPETESQLRELVQRLYAAQMLGRVDAQELHAPLPPALQDFAQNTAEKQAQLQGWLQSEKGAAALAADVADLNSRYYQLGMAMCRQAFEDGMRTAVRLLAAQDENSLTKRIAAVIMSLA